jgi:hypothetical protein
MTPNWHRTQSNVVQVVGQVESRLIALFRLLFQAFQADRLQIAGRLRLQESQRDGVVLADLLESFHQRRTLERRPSREQFIQNHAQRIDVGGRPDLIDRARSLLRRHVTGRAEDIARLRVGVVRAGPLGESKISDLRRAVTEQ